MGSYNSFIPYIKESYKAIGPISILGLLIFKRGDHPLANILNHALLETRNNLVIASKAKRV